MSTWRWARRTRPAGCQWAATAAKADFALFTVAWSQRFDPSSTSRYYVVYLAKNHWHTLGGAPEDLDVREFVRGALDAPTVAEATEEIPVTPD